MRNLVSIFPETIYTALHISVIHDKFINVNIYLFIYLFVYTPKMGNST